MEEWEPLYLPQELFLFRLLPQAARQLPMKKGPHKITCRPSLLLINLIIRSDAPFSTLTYAATSFVFSSISGNLNAK
jgi:hypothetical protein